MLMTCVAFAFFGAADEAPKHNLAPRYVPGQELTYVGMALEKQSGLQGAAYEQPYDLETSALVGRIGATKVAELCCYTTIRLPVRDRDFDAAPFDDVAGFRFDHLKVTPAGAASWLAGPRKGKGVSCPAEGWSAGELGFLLEAPAEALPIGASWIVKRGDAPDLNCTVAATDLAEGEACVRVVCKEQSRNWARADQRPAWRATSTVWLGQNRGLAVRVHRDYEQRQPGETVPSRTVMVKYALAANIAYRGPELQDRLADFELAARVQGDYESLLQGKAERPARAVLGTLKHDLKLAAEQQPRATPYRSALAEMLRATTAAEAGLAQRRPAPPAPGALAVATLGQPARPWSVKEIDGARRSLKDFKGQAVVLVQVNPESTLSRKALTDVLATARAGGAKTIVLAACPKADEATAKKLRDAVPGDYRICQAMSADRAYGVKALPHTIAVDAQGLLRANFLGYGPELVSMVATLNAPALGAKDAPAAK
jgi:hypothetical protein